MTINGALGMLMIMRSTFSSLLIVSFFGLVVLGLGMGMNVDEKGNMSDCPFMVDQGSLCPMGLFEHIAKWQQAVTVIPRPSANIFLLFALLAAFSYFKITLQPKILPNKFGARSRARKESELRASNPLLAAFSDGILNPKIYEFVNI